MKDAIQYFIAANILGLSPFKWVMTILFLYYIIWLFKICWRKGFKDLDILVLLLAFTILLRSIHSLFLTAGTPDQAMRLLFLLLPVAMVAFVQLIYAKKVNSRKQTFYINTFIIALVIINIFFGGGLLPGSPHWWMNSYRLVLLNQLWLVLSIGYSIYIVYKSSGFEKPYGQFMMVTNVALIIYVLGNLLFSFWSIDKMYVLMGHLALVANFLMAIAFTYLISKLRNYKEREALSKRTKKFHINIYDIIKLVKADELIRHLKINHPKCIPQEIERLSKRQQLHAILMLHEMSIKDCADYTFITPQAVKVYRSRIRKLLDVN